MTENKVLSYNLQFFAKMGPGGEKTEKATHKKLSEARKQGQVAKSNDLVTAVMLMGLFLGISMFAEFMKDRFMGSFYSTYGRIQDVEQMGYNSLLSVLHDLFIEILVVSAPIFVLSVGIAILVNYYQVKWKVTTKPLQPKLNKISPMSGIKRMFSLRTLMEFIKSLLKIGIIVYIVYGELTKNLESLLIFYDLGLFQAIAYIGEFVIQIGIKLCVALFFIGVIDYIFEKWKFSQDQMMTKQEIKDEYKNSEGDPKVKAKQRARMAEASRRRMMSNVPKADVVITNPTHFAVAVQYNSFQHKAPVVVAKGADLVARRIKELAKEHKVEIVENKALARMLYYNVDLDQEIPQELYKAVADILVLVYSMKGKS